MKIMAWDDNVRAWDDLRWAEFDTDGIYLKTSSDENYRLSDEQTKEAAEIIKKLEKAPFTGKVYLRFNDIPKNGKSKNWATGKLEKGLSVYELKYEIVEGVYRITGGALEGALIKYIFERAPIYFMQGDEVGTGADREPLLANVQILGNAKYDIDKEGYVKYVKA